MMKQSTLPALIIEPKATHRSSVIWLHGLGADGHDFAPVTAQLQLPDSLGVRFILPHAPQIPVTVNGGMRMPAWYDIAHTDIGRTPDQAGIAESRVAIEQLIDRELESGIASERVIVAGFSQGGVMAIETIAHHQEKLRGAIALSCYLARSDDLPPAKGSVPVFLAHGTQDTVVPHSMGVAARDTLEKQGYEVDWQSYVMPHSVCASEIMDIRRWLMALLG